MGFRDTLVIGCLFGAFGILISGCGNTAPVQQSGYAAKSDIRDSFKINERGKIMNPSEANHGAKKGGRKRGFSVVKSGSSGAKGDISVSKDRETISILKSALEKEFLLQVMMTEQTPSPQFHALESRIVSFRKKGDKVYLMETSQGHNTSPDIPQVLLLAQFPILHKENEVEEKEVEDQITIDFNAGMSAIFTAGEWKRTDEESGSEIDGAVETAQVVFSYIDEIHFSSNNYLVISQVAQLSGQGKAGANSQATVSVQYALVPYLENKNFVPTKAPTDNDRVGFLATSPLVNKEGGFTSYATKHDISKPIVIAISANTPVEYRQAVKDGILYWNRALGKDVISVIDAPKGVSAPSVEYNVVQWVDTDKRGYAYADAQVDPRTGETLHQHLYITSLSVSQVEFNARQFVQLPSNGSAVNKGARRFGLAGFKAQNLCDMELNRAVGDGFAEIMAKGLSKEQTLKAAQDLLRETVAHEMGHAMGLRHNFAGSLAANYRLEDREEIVKKYLASGSAPDDLITSSSLMDYEKDLEAMLNGDHLSKGLKASEYDQKAIQILYFNAHYANNEMPLFCTDGHSSAGKIVDCQKFDAGSSVVEWVKYKGHNALKNLPYTMLFAYQNSKNSIHGADPVTVAGVSFDAKLKAKSALDAEEKLLSLFHSDSTLLSIMRSYSYMNGTNEPIARKMLNEYLLKEIERNGGLSQVFLQVDSDFAEREYARFETLLSDSSNLKGIDSYGKAFEFSSDEVALMKDRAREFYGAFQVELVNRETKILSGSFDNSWGDDSKAADSEKTKLVSGDLGELLAQYLYDRANELLFSKKENLVIVDAGDSNYSLPAFFYPYKLRETATSFLRQARSGSVAWGFVQRETLLMKYNDMLAQAFPPIVDTLSPVSPIAGDIAKSSTSKGLINNKEFMRRYVSGPAPLVEWLKEGLALSSQLKGD